MSKLNNKVAVVTGASKGIGAAIAQSLAAEGAAVVVNYASSQSGADRVVAAITAAGGASGRGQGGRFGRRRSPGTHRGCVAKNGGGDKLRSLCFELTCLYVQVQPL